MCKSKFRWMASGCLESDIEWNIGLAVAIEQAKSETRERLGHWFSEGSALLLLVRSSGMAGVL